MNVLINNLRFHLTFLFHHLILLIRILIQRYDATSRVIKHDTTSRVINDHVIHIWWTLHIDHQLVINSNFIHHWFKHWRILSVECHELKWIHIDQLNLSNQTIFEKLSSFKISLLLFLSKSHCCYFYQFVLSNFQFRSLCRFYSHLN